MAALHREAKDKQIARGGCEQIVVAFRAEPWLLGFLEVPVLLEALCVSLAKYLTLSSKLFISLS